MAKENQFAHLKGYVPTKNATDDVMAGYISTGAPTTPQIKKDQFGTGQILAESQIFPQPTLVKDIMFRPDWVPITFYHSYTNSSGNTMNHLVRANSAATYAILLDSVQFSSDSSAADAILFYTNTSSVDRTDSKSILMTKNEISNLNLGKILLLPDTEGVDIRAEVPPTTKISVVLIGYLVPTSYIS